MFIFIYYILYPYMYICNILCVIFIINIIRIIYSYIYNNICKIFTSCYILYIYKEQQNIAF